MKVQRTRKIDVSSDTHTIQIILTTSDVKYIFIHIRELLNKSLGMSYQPTFLKKDLLFTIRQHFKFLGEYGASLDEWAFDIAIRNGFILKTSEIGYVINPKVMELRPGRTSKEVSSFLHS